MEKKRRLIDEKGRIFGLINVLDILIVLVVVVAVVGLSTRFTDGVLLVTKTPLTVTFYIEEAPDFAVNVISVGDPVTEATFSSAIGRVTSVVAAPSVSWGRTSTGLVNKSTKEGYSSAYVTMECEGVMNSDGSFTLDKSKYFIGQTITLNVGNSRLENGRFSAITKRD